MKGDAGLTNLHPLSKLSPRLGRGGALLFRLTGWNSQLIFPFSSSLRKAENGRALAFFETKPAMRPVFPSVSSLRI